MGYKTPSCKLHNAFACLFYYYCYHYYTWRDGIGRKGEEKRKKFLFLHSSVTAKQRQTRGKTRRHKGGYSDSGIVALLSDICPCFLENGNFTDDKQTRELAGATTTSWRCKMKTTATETAVDRQQNGGMFVFFKDVWSVWSSREDGLCAQREKCNDEKYGEVHDHGLQKHRRSTKRPLERHGDAELTTINQRQLHIQPLRGGERWWGLLEIHIHTWDLCCFKLTYLIIMSHEDINIHLYYCCCFTLTKYMSTKTFYASNSSRNFLKLWNEFNLQSLHLVTVLLSNFSWYS